jgi:hypothetical protein
MIRRSLISSSLLGSSLPKQALRVRRGQLRSTAHHLIDRSAKATPTIKPTMTSDERIAAVIFALGSSFHELRRRVWLAIISSPAFCSRPPQNASGALFAAPPVLAQLIHRFRDRPTTAVREWGVTLEIHAGAVIGRGLLASRGEPRRQTKLPVSQRRIWKRASTMTQSVCDDRQRQDSPASIVPQKPQCGGSTA